MAATRERATREACSPRRAWVRARFWTLLFWLTTLATALPLAIIRHPPFTDLPEHVAAIATLARLLPGGGGAPYEIAFGSSQYFLYHLTGAVLTRAFGDAILAHGILLAGVAVLWPMSLRALLRALKRDERLAIFGCMLVYNRALVIGFLPFIASVPIALFALAALLRHLEAPSLRRGVTAGALALVLFYTHASLVLPFALAATVMIILRASAARSVRLAIVAGVPFAPSAVAAFGWWRAGSLAAPSGQPEMVAHLPIGASISAMPIWTFEIWRSHVDELCAGAWWTAFAVILAIGLKKDLTKATLFALVPFASTLVLYLVTPHYLGMAGYLSVRLAPILALFAVLALEPKEGRAGNLPLVAAAIAALVMAGDSAFEMRRAEREQVGDLDALLAHARPGSRLAMLNFDTRSPRVAFWPYAFAGSYHRAGGGSVASYSFTEMAHWPIHYRAGAGPPVHSPVWVYTPCEYRYRSDGAYYDYVLVQGEDVDPFKEPTPGPQFKAVARSRSFTLFEKTAAPSDDTTLERGPCAAPPGPG